jgi:hypothetical protein
MNRTLVFAFAWFSIYFLPSPAFADRTTTGKGRSDQDEIVAGIREAFSNGAVPTSAQLEGSVWNCQVVDARRDIFNVVPHDGQFAFSLMGHLYENTNEYRAGPWRLTAMAFSSDSFEAIDSQIDRPITKFARVSTRGSLIVEYCTSDSQTAAVSDSAIGDTSLFVYRYSICQRAP